MDLSPYVEELRRQLLVAAEAGGDEASLLAERLTAPLQAATRLVLLDALSTAASEITGDLAPGSVDLRLRGHEPEFVVTMPPTDGYAEPAEPAAETSATNVALGAPGDDADAGTSRVTLRLPEPLKARIEDAAARDGLSVNAWLVRTLAAVVEPSAAQPPRDRRSLTGGDRYIGWAR